MGKSRRKHQPQPVEDQSKDQDVEVAQAEKVLDSDEAEDGAEGEHEPENGTKLMHQDPRLVEVAEMAQRRDEAMQAAESAKAQVASLKQRLEDLEMELHELRDRTRVSSEEAATWKALTETYKTQATEETVCLEGKRKLRKDTLGALQRDLALEQKLATEQDLQAERQRRMQADARCMQIQVLNDFVTGKLDIDLATLQKLLDKKDGKGGGRRKGEGLAAAEGHGLDVQKLTRQQQQKQHEEMKALVALSNQELHRWDRSAAELMDDDGLPRLLAMLKNEGILEGPIEQPARDPGRTERLRRAILR